MRKNTHEMAAIKLLSDAEHERDLSRRVHETVKTEIDQVARKADLMLQRLREAASQAPKFRLVRLK